ncbi:class A beta-lactamase-related serine hydrolase [Nocardia brasiliensis]|uniref:class A beta-lactamase-related serine hydrolase n=1 Tax=Nocardia brasiliensis TaxID=37326 RepID=UPI00245672A7|nr:class A beta-lactamase-related serine hydrolase [Nocardia brasiliensis]
MNIPRRAMLFGGAAATAYVAGVGSNALAAPVLAGSVFAATYRAVTTRAGGRWHSSVTNVSAGAPESVVAEDVDFVIEGASVQKLAVATALLDAVDRGVVSLSDTVELTGEVIAEGAGIYHRQVAFGDRLTLSNVLVAMLQVSDNTAVRLIGMILPGAEINRILGAKGFERTRVEPLPDNPHRFWLGVTTPREMNDLLCRLVRGTLLSEASTAALLRVLTWSSVGYVDGVRRTMSSMERARVATKYGADEDRRHEAGVVFDEAGAAQLVYTFFTDQAPQTGNYGATHPVVEAHAILGRAMVDGYQVLSKLPSLFDPVRVHRDIAAGGRGEIR